MNLLSASTSGVVVDIVFFLLIIGGIFAGAQRGFISGVSRLAGTLFAIAFALFFCVSFSAFLENNFGMTSSISDGLTGAFSNLEMLNTDISAKNLETALEEAKIPGFIASIIVSVFADMQLPEGTTIAMLISPIVAHWISVVISFVSLVVLIKIAVWLLDKIFSRAAEEIGPVRIVNRMLGGVLGLIEIMLAIFLVLAICVLIGNESIESFFAESSVVGAIYFSDWFRDATAYVVSFDWLRDYILATE